MGIREDVLTKQGADLKAWREGQTGEDGKPLSQTKAAMAIHSTQSTWAAWERGHKAPDAYYAGKLEELTAGAVKASAWAYPRHGTSAARKADEGSAPGVAESPVAKAS